VFVKLVNSENLIIELVSLIKNSKYIVAFTGAGISTESGIPDFRSPGGLWERYNPAEYAQYSSFLTHPEKFWQMHQEASSLIQNAEPNAAHKGLAFLEKNFNLKTVITQNIDFLHKRAGSTNVLELHGSGEFGKCLSCSKIYHYKTIDKLINEKGIPPLCTNCAGLIKPNVILFGEPVPDNVFYEARREASKADLVIIVGSSLSVAPAAFLPQLALLNGSKLVIVNEDETHYDDDATVVIRDKAGLVFSWIIEILSKIL